MQIQNVLQIMKKKIMDTITYFRLKSYSFNCADIISEQRIAMKG